MNVGGGGNCIRRAFGAVHFLPARVTSFGDNAGGRWGGGGTGDLQGLLGAGGPEAQRREEPGSGSRGELMTEAGTGRSGS